MHQLGVKNLVRIKDAFTKLTQKTLKDRISVINITKINYKLT